MARIEKFNKNARHAYLNSILEFSTGLTSIAHYSEASKFYVR